MPRSDTILASQSSLQCTTLPPSSGSTSENLALLRTQWKWAAFCQFFSTFAPLFPMKDVSISDIESDLVEGTNHVLSRTITRLLYTLTYDRKVSVDNWQSMLYKQYAKRAPDLNPLSAQPLRDSSPTSSEDKAYIYENAPQLESLESLEQPPAEGRFSAQPGVSAENNDTNDWSGLSMIQKLDSMHLITEWQFQHPMRLRTLMKNDNEDASWRIEPIGYDRQSNAYWLIGSDRLWIQRSLPKSQHKAKNIQRGDNEISQANTSGRTKRRRLEKDLELKGPIVPAVGPKARDREAKTRAKVKLDTHSQPASGMGHADGFHGTQHKTTSRPILGTRASARLRGALQDEQQPILREWMGKGTDPDVQPTSELKTGLESDLDELSELTELSEDSQDESPNSIEMLSLSDVIGNHSSKDPIHTFDEVQKQSQKDFVEWETICVTLRDWEHIADRFASGTHHSEKALYKYLINHLVPSVTENLKITERQKRLEEAITYRKRSSRIALKESEREQALAVARKQAEEEERLSRARRLEARQQREEERHMRLENVRVQRRKDRESKEAQRERMDAERGMEVEQGVLRALTDTSPSSFRQPSTNPSRVGDWELDCEICQRHEINPVDNTPMMSCGSCLKWQHVACHDFENKRADLPNRDWDSVDFICRSCRAKANRPIESESNVLYESKESTRSISRTNPPITHGQPALPPGPVYKLPPMVPDFMRDASLASPASTHLSNIIGTQNMSVPMQDPTVANFVYDQPRWNISSPTRILYHQATPENWLGLEPREERDWTPYEHSSVLDWPGTGNPYLATSLDASQPTFKLSHYTTMHRDRQFS